MLRKILPLLLILCLAATGFGQELKFKKLGTYATGVFDEGAAEIAAYHAASKKTFFTNASKNSITILDVKNPSNPTLIKEVSMETYGGGVNSVAVSQDLVAVAVEAKNNYEPGKVVFLNLDGEVISSVEVGALPDMLTFNHAGTKVIVANEGEPFSGDGVTADDYVAKNPEGSVSIIDVSSGAMSATVTTVRFTAYNARKFQLINRGIKLDVNPAITVAMDLEPEYVAVSPDDKQAFVTLQENNTFAVINLTTNALVEISPLGFKKHGAQPTLTHTADLDFPNFGTQIDGNAVRFGGLSGIYPQSVEMANGKVSKLHFVSHPDRGPNGEPVNGVKISDNSAVNALRPFILPDFQSRILKFTLDVNSGQVSLQDTTFLYWEDSLGVKHPITGLPNIPGADEIPVGPLANATGAEFKVGDVFFDSLGYDRFGADMEGIVIDADDNTYWMCDEYRPAVYHFDASGKMLHRFVAKGTGALGGQAEGYYGTETFPEVYNKRRANRGFEAIAMDQENDMIYAFIQSPLDNPNTSKRGTSQVIRILAMNKSGIPQHEYIYLLERPDLRKTAMDKMGDAFYAGNGKIYVMERDDDVTANGKKYVYEVDLNFATDILARTAEAWEGRTAEEIAAEGVNVAFKLKMFNLPSLGYTPNDKAEGLAWVEEMKSFIVINDNDFGLDPANAAKVQLGVIAMEAGKSGLDANNNDTDIKINDYNVFGMYQPDAITAMVHDSQTYYITVNEGDVREYPGFLGGAESERISALTVSPALADTKAKAGRLNVTKQIGDLNGDGTFDKLFAFGARSFTIWDAYGNMVWDSGNELEKITAEAYPANFNASNTNNTKKNRSDDKGPEPEAITIGEIDGKTYAFIGLERIGGVMVYDVTNPLKPEYKTYFNNRNFTANVESADAGDLGPEHIIFVPAEDSTSGFPMLIVANEVSGSVSFFSINDLSTSNEEVAGIQPNLIVYPNPAIKEIRLNQTTDFAIFNLSGKFLQVFKNTDNADISDYLPGIYFIQTKDMQMIKFVKM